MEIPRAEFRRRAAERNGEQGADVEIAESVVLPVGLVVVAQAEPELDGNADRDALPPSGQLGPMPISP